MTKEQQIVVLCNAGVNRQLAERIIDGLYDHFPHQARDLVDDELRAIALVSRIHGEIFDETSLSS